MCGFSPLATASRTQRKNLWQQQDKIVFFTHNAHANLMLKVTQYSKNSKVLHRANVGHEDGERGGTAGQNTCNYSFLKLAGTGSPQDQTVLMPEQETWVDAESRTGQQQVTGPEGKRAGRDCSWAGLTEQATELQSPPELS
ncbi:hypothetical protein E2C01_013233 [Portunus trituberculatus]|uniref:Uncharacterized protein n=1 Tax=Portunus trituberculatus TaxID=210409 RepID=A0A5B7DGJ7_PORTR|nr:hypothetical protein [Portunus trituberculatus]